MTRLDTLLLRLPLVNRQANLIARQAGCVASPRAISAWRVLVAEGRLSENISEEEVALLQVVARGCTQG